MPSDAFPTAAPLIGAASAVRPARPITAPVRTVNKIFRIVVSSLAVGEQPTLDVVRRTDPVGPPRIPAMKDATSPPPQQRSTDLPYVMMFVNGKHRTQKQVSCRTDPDTRRAPDWIRSLLKAYYDQPASSEWIICQHE
jgi:hypothetical protein